MFSIFSKQNNISSIQTVQDGNKRFLNKKGILNKLIPKNHKIPNTQYEKLIYIDKMAININREKERILIAKGLHNSQFDLLNNIIVILSLIIAGINLIGSALDSQERKYIGQSTEVAFEIIVGIFGLIIAIIAKMRDQKEDLVHSMLSAVNQCDDFLNDLENKMSNYIRFMITSDDKFNYPIHKDDYDIQIEAESYKQILVECDKVMAKFTSDDAQAVTNGTIYCCKSFLCCFIYDPQPLRNLMTKYNDNYENYDKDRYCTLYHKEKDDNIENIKEDFQISGDVKIDGNVLLTGKAYNQDSIELQVINDNDTQVSNSISYARDDIMI